jgi:ABC-type uncharacterized transport system permease subunit
MKSVFKLLAFVIIVTALGIIGAFEWTLWLIGVIGGIILGAVLMLIGLVLISGLCFWHLFLSPLLFAGPRR